MEEFSLRDHIPDLWKGELAAALDTPSFAGLCDFLAKEKEEHRHIYPESRRIFQALHDLAPERVRVVILGQDPYHGEGQALGRSFGVPNTLTPKPPSLRNIFRELESDLGIKAPSGASDLSGWAAQGVLLLNTVLTVRAEEPLSHREKGWEEFTDAILTRLNGSHWRLIFVLWGAQAQKKKALLDSKRHGILETAHPSPLSARRGFFGSRVFSRINQDLELRGEAPIDWARITIRPDFRAT